MISEAESQQQRRYVRLVLVNPAGGVVGSVGPFSVDLPWWQEVRSVVDAARRQLGIDVTIIRLLNAERDRPHGGEVTYLAEVSQTVAFEPWEGRLEPHPLRQSYADIGGPAADLDWATRILAARGLAPVGKAVQMRSWNLSSIWNIPVGRESVWLKVVPPFFAHEPQVLVALADAPVPRLLGHDGTRMLLAEVPGIDMYDAPLPRLLEMVTLLVDIQSSWLGRLDRLQSTALPDWRGSTLIAAIEDVVERTGPELSKDELVPLRRFVIDLRDRFAALESCGMPDTLIHGDFHPGNVRGTDRQLVLLDWGDSGIGHPLLDLPAFLERMPPGHIEAIKQHWMRAWLAKRPDCDCYRAASLIGPVAAARQAVVYRKFLDNIEPSEHVYHRHDPATWLRRAAQLSAAGN
jgi:hypothetical protein